jgi:hypothetical protein
VVVREQKAYSLLSTEIDTSAGFEREEKMQKGGSGDFISKSTRDDISSTAAASLKVEDCSYRESVYSVQG